MTPNDYDPRPGPEGSHDAEAWKQLVNDMHDWGTALEKWGKRVRHDILALEALLAERFGLSEKEFKAELQKHGEAALKKRGISERYKAGDPEDPPPPPWKKK